jgi:RNA polymerase sigma-70 factor, ECF subfamily
VVGPAFRATWRGDTAWRRVRATARRRVRAAQPPATPTARQASIVRAFKQAWEARDIGALIGLLDPDATATADGGGLAGAVLRPVEGGEQVARGFVGPPADTPRHPIGPLPAAATQPATDQDPLVHLPRDGWR